MKRILAAFAALFVAIALAIGTATALFWPTMLVASHTPRVDFAAPPPLDSDAWRAPAMWLAYPGQPSTLKPFPPGVFGGVPHRHSAAHVLIVHPASYFGRTHWNAPLGNPDAQIRARATVRPIASLFDDAAAVYAPHYRDAGLGALMAGSDDSRRALALAERDVRAAFARFAAAVPPHAPVILAGEGEGALMLMRLMRARLVQQAFAARLVAVYLGGWPITLHQDLPPLGLPPCTRADQAGCIVAWTSFARFADPRMIMAEAATARGGTPAPDDRLVCVDPLTGDGRAAPGARNLGSLAVDDEVSGARLIPGAVGAACDPATGLLMIDTPPHLGDLVMPGNDFADLSFALFWANLRADAARREAAWAGPR